MIATAITCRPATEGLALGGAQLFTATLSGTTDTRLTWYVNGVKNGPARAGRSLAFRRMINEDGARNDARR